MKEKTQVCSICGKTFIGYGNNAQPVNNGRCCNDCNNERVMPERIIRYFMNKYDVSNVEELM